MTIMSDETRPYSAVKHRGLPFTTVDNTDDRWLAYVDRLMATAQPAIMRGMLRDGQILFVALSDMDSENASKISGTEYDPYDDDTRIWKFAERVYELWLDDL